MISDGDNGSGGSGGSGQSASDSIGTEQVGAVDVDAPVRVISDGDNGSTGGPGGSGGSGGSGDPSRATEPEAKPVAEADPSEYPATASPVVESATAGSQADTLPFTGAGLALSRWVWLCWRAVSRCGSVCRSGIARGVYGA